MDAIHRNVEHTPRLFPDWIRRLWRDLPLWYVLTQVLYLTYVYLTVFEPPRVDLALTGLAPLAWFAAVVARRRHRGPAGAGISVRASGFGVAAVLAILAPFALLPITTAPGDIKVYFEINTIVLAVVFALHCYSSRGITDLLSIFGIGFVYGVILENSGIWMGFFHEPGYFAYLPGLPAPLATMCGWTVCFYVALWMTDRLSPRVSWIAKALLATLVILSMDLHTDPAAIVFRWWSWPQAFSHRFLGVPLINFIAWASAAVPFYAAYFFVQSLSRNNRLLSHLRLAALMPAVLATAALFVMGLTWLLLGFDSPEMALFKRTLFAAAQRVVG